MILAFDDVDDEGEPEHGEEKFDEEYWNRVGDEAEEMDDAGTDGLSEIEANLAMILPLMSCTCFNLVANVSRSYGVLEEGQ